jgi:ABC-type antimicrobial peptide transport system permease subunit
MDLTGSIADITVPLSMDLFSGSTGEVIGSSAVDTILNTILGLPNLLLALVAGIGADLGSTLGGPA